VRLEFASGNTTAPHPILPGRTRGDAANFLEELEKEDPFSPKESTQAVYEINPSVREALMDWAARAGAESAVESLRQQHAQEEQARMTEARQGRDTIYELGGGETPAAFAAAEDAEPGGLEGGAAGDPTYGGSDMEAPAPASDKHPQLSNTSPIGQRPCDIENVPMSEKDVQKSMYREWWEEAKRVELFGHDETGTFAYVESIPEDKRPIRMKFVFAWKTDAKGMIVKCKARLVAIGCTQLKGIDYLHSSSACPYSASIKLFLAIATEKGFHIRHWDVVQAYTKADLQEEIYLKFPPKAAVSGGTS